MIPVGTSVNPGELRSGPKWEKTFISCLGVPDTPPDTYIVYTQLYTTLHQIKTKKPTMKTYPSSKKQPQHCLGPIPWLPKHGSNSLLQTCSTGKYCLTNCWNVPRIQREFQAWWCVLYWTYSELEQIYSFNQQQLIGWRVYVPRNLYRHAKQHTNT